MLPNTYLYGETRVGSSCTIGPNSVVRDSVIADGCRVECSVLEKATLEEGVDVGPFGHLREGSYLARGVHVGNFGEVKNSYLGPQVKMGHFSYVGDARVGARTNIGAGTITCNYGADKNKHRTVIGEDVFIGSDTMMVAPICIGARSRTGAGSVVTKDVPSSVTAVGVPARVIMPREKEQARKFQAYATLSEDTPDPVVQTIETLRNQIMELSARVEVLESEIKEAALQSKLDDHRKKAV